jgi:hypothetical protein
MEVVNCELTQRLGPPRYSGENGGSVLGRYVPRGRYIATVNGFIVVC